MLHTTEVKHRRHIESDTLEVENTEFDSLHTGKGYKKIRTIDKQVIDRYEEFTDNSYYEILKCPKCNFIVFRESYFVNDVLNNLLLYPDFKEWHISPNNDVEELLTNDLRIIYGEIIKSFNVSHFLSSSILVRILLERICKSKGIDERSLYNMINQLSLEEEYKSALHAVRNIGNAAAHDARAYKDEIYLTITAMNLCILKIYETVKETRAMNNIKALSQTMTHLKENRK
jgi:hypothetical protein